MVRYGAGSFDFRPSTPESGCRTLISARWPVSGLEVGSRPALVEDHPVVFAVRIGAIRIGRARYQEPAREHTLMVRSRVRLPHPRTRPPGRLPRTRSMLVGDVTATVLSGIGLPRLQPSHVIAAAVRKTMASAMSASRSAVSGFSGIHVPGNATAWRCPATRRLPLHRMPTVQSPPTVPERPWQTFRRTHAAKPLLRVGTESPHAFAARAAGWTAEKAGCWPLTPPPPELQTTRDVNCSRSGTGTTIGTGMRFRVPNIGVFCSFFTSPTDSGNRQSAAVRRFPTRSRTSTTPSSAPRSLGERVGELPARARQSTATSLDWALHGPAAPPASTERTRSE